MKQKLALNRLQGQRVHLSGKFAWGEEDRLGAIVEAHQGKRAFDLESNTNYLVIADASAGKTVQKRAASLNAKGASIRVMSAADFRATFEPTLPELVALIRNGSAGAQVVNAILPGVMHMRPPQATRTIAGENFDAADLSTFNFSGTLFESCSFVGATLHRGSMPLARGCDFSRANVKDYDFRDVAGSKFSGATMDGCHFRGDLSGTDFSDATMSKVFFSGVILTRHPTSTTSRKMTFARAKLKGCLFQDDFTELNLNEAVVASTGFAGTFKSATLVRASLKAASFADCKLQGADFTSASLERANFAQADLSDAVFTEADVRSAIFFGASTTGCDLSKAKNYDPKSSAGGVVGPALTELDSVAGKASRIQFSCAIESSSEGNAEIIRFDTAQLRWGGGARLPHRFNVRRLFTGKPVTLSSAVLSAARVMAGEKLRFETIEVSTSKSPVGANELRGKIAAALSEAFEQAPPEPAKLAELTKTWREERHAAGAAQRAERDAAKKLAEKAQAKAKKQIEKKIEKAVGKVNDIATFLRALELRADVGKIGKATKMLKAEKFQLFNDVSDEHVTGVVKSQTDPDLVYACRINKDGNYSCCTQNLNVCGGLRGSPCKHLLVLIIGLVQAGKLDPSTIDGWVAKSASAKSELDKEKMGEIFIRYKGAEAGEVDWRPTETLPEDYYAL
jgi:uncharacterized protein YjbI with pentapeptide repeats